MRGRTQPSEAEEAEKRGDCGDLFTIHRSILIVSAKLYQRGVWEQNPQAACGSPYYAGGGSVGFCHSCWPRPLVPRSQP